MNSEYIWKRLDQDFARFPNLRAAQPASETEISDAERTIQVPFASVYRQFLAKYGGGMVDAYPVFGLRPVPVMGDDYWNVAEVTSRFRAEGWPGCEHWAIVSMDGAGNPIGLDPLGRVWLSDHDVGEILQLARTFEEWLVRLLK